VSIKGSIIKVEDLDRAIGFYSSVREVAQAVRAAAHRQQSLPVQASAPAAQAGEAA